MRAPTVRSALVTGRSRARRTGPEGPKRRRARTASSRERPVTGGSFRGPAWRRRRGDAGVPARRESRVTVAALVPGAAGRASSRSVRPTTSSSRRWPSRARISRTSWAMARKKRITSSGVPRNFRRRSSRWVAMPAGQVLRWHCRAITQPAATRAAEPNPYSSAPRSAAITTSRPVLSPPSTCRRTRPRRPWRTRTCCVSARPSSQGVPAFLIELQGEAPVPPSCPATTTASAWALATPAAMVPMPASEASLTPTVAAGFTRLRS